MFLWRALSQLGRRVTTQLTGSSLLLFTEVRLCKLSGLGDLLLELAEVHVELHIRVLLFLVGGRVEVLQLEVADLPHEVAPVLDVVDLGNQLLLESLGRIQTLVLLADHHLEIVVSLLNFRDVDGLQLAGLKLAGLTSAICVNH